MQKNVHIIFLYSAKNATWNFISVRPFVKSTIYWSPYDH